MRIRTLGIAAGLLVAALGLLWIVAPRSNAPASDTASSIAPGAPTVLVPDLIYGRVATLTGTTYEGRLRWNRTEEATWDDEFNGYKETNPWADFVPALQEQKRRAVKIFGFELGSRDRAGRLTRPYVARFGDLARIDVTFSTITVTPKNGNATALRRSSASDIDDGLRVWTRDGAVVDLDSSVLTRLEFLSTQPLPGAPARLWGAVQAGEQTFTGFVAWNRDDGLATDTLDGRTSDGPRSLPYSRIRTIERRGTDRVTVTLTDGSTMVLGGTQKSGTDNRGVMINDQTFGRVHVPWQAFQRLDLTEPPSHRSFDSFAPGRPLTATVSTEDGGRVSGRLVFDLDESETTDLLDASARSIDYSIPFDRIVAIEPRRPQPDGSTRTTVRLSTGVALDLEPTGDLTGRNGGLLVWSDEAAPPQHIAWAAVRSIAFP